MVYYSIYKEAVVYCISSQFWLFLIYDASYNSFQRYNINILLGTEDDALQPLSLPFHLN